MKLEGRCSNYTSPVTIYNCLGPNFPENALISPPADNDTELKKCMKEYDIWMLCR